MCEIPKQRISWNWREVADLNLFFYLQNLCTVIHKFKSGIVSLAAPILGFWGKRQVHVFSSWGFRFHTAREHPAYTLFVSAWARPLLIPNHLLVYYSEYLNKAVPSFWEFTIYFTLSEQLFDQRLLKPFCSSILCIKSWGYNNEYQNATGKLRPGFKGHCRESGFSGSKVFVQQHRF